ncbi:MAG: lipocalin-like domain-containing protein [Roseiflexaceae bacterium]
MYRRMYLMIVVLALAACTGPGAQPFEPRAHLSAVEAAGGTNSAGFARATAPRPFVFPRDHGPHPEYATEWWYYTGNLDTEDGQHFGFQLTFFRSALAPAAPTRESAWATTNIYMAHFTVTDVAAGQFHAFDRFSRGAAGLAGATSEPYRVWLEDWGAEGDGPAGMAMRLRAAQDGVAIDLALTNERPPLLQGDHGLSQKSATPGNASYYYSLTSMATTGAIEAGGRRYAVRGLSWMDHEFGTSALDPGAAGWDWFGLQLGDGRALSYARIRNTDGSTNFAFGALAGPDGSTRDLSASEFIVEPLGVWRSPRSGAEYPSGWRLRVPSAELDLQLTPWLADQELPVALVYWEGAVRIEGSAGGKTVGGNGYVELTGYIQRTQEEPRVR